MSVNDYRDRAAKVRHEWIWCRDHTGFVCIRPMQFDSEGRREVSYYPDGYEFVSEETAVYELEKLERQQLCK